ncbi:MAG: xanthine dehydrogenase accessory protein XdhC [Sphingomonadales bacterium]
MPDLLSRLRDALGNLEPAVVVTVADIEGSTPRETGARMLVTANASTGTIGGGRLEYEAIAKARLILAGRNAGTVAEFPLGPSLGQCCGGHVTILFERAAEPILTVLETMAKGDGVVLTPLARPTGRLMLTPAAFAAADLPTGLKSAANGALEHSQARCVRLDDGDRWLVEPTDRHEPLVALFGAGHVGHALAGALAALPCRVRWIDSRAELFPDPAPAAIEVIAAVDPVQLARGLPPGSFCVVMTHSHDLDFDICEAVLKRDDFGYLGLIGSATKRRKFERRFVAKGGNAAMLDRLTCPIGIGKIKDKRPAVIATLAAAELLIAFQDAKAEGALP